ncbi:MAG: glycosyltransferase family 1 protein [Marmoricola sp.]|nr:glycosyltransferase family 1 protein [Marmoricola sp.]
MRASRSHHRQPRILFGVTAAVTARMFLVGQLGHFAAQGWQVHLVCGEPGLEAFAQREGVAAVHHVPMAREPSATDPAALIRTWRLLHRIRPDVVVLGTPKMGLLGMVAAFLTRVPERIYLVHGFRAQGLAGRRRRLLVALERLACGCATRVVAVSPSLRDALLAARVVRPAKVVVLGHGSANGVDVKRFVPAGPDGVLDARATFGLPPEARVVAFVGRLTKDKGIGALVDVWDRVAAAVPDAWLLVAGTEEPAGPADERALAGLRALPRVMQVGHVDAIEAVYRASDLLLMLSSREGLPTVVLEAAACEVPAVAFGVTGVVDAIEDKTTGLCSAKGDVRHVQELVLELLGVDERRTTMGQAARRRVVDGFAQETVWQAWSELVTGAHAQQSRSRISS